MTVGSPLDEQLVAAAQDGCRDSFGELYRRHAARVRRLLHARARDAHLADDLTSETFLRAWAGIDGFAGGNVEAWLVRIAGNLVRDHFRLSRVRHEWLSGDVTDVCGPTVGPEVVVVEQEERRAARRLVTEALARLTPDQRQCLVLRFLDEHDVRRTAAALGRSEGAVRVLQHRAMSAVRRSAT